MALGLALGLPFVQGGIGGLVPNPVTAGLWAEFAADVPGSYTTRVSGADTFITEWRDNLGDATKNWSQATEAAQPKLIIDANGIPCIRGDGLASIAVGSVETLNWLRGQSNATLVLVTRQNSTPSSVERVIGWSVSGSSNPRLVFDNNATGARRIQARRQSADATTTFSTGINIPTAIQREAVRFRPIDGLMDYIGDNLAELTSASFPTSGAIGDTASNSAAIFGYANSNFCDTDIYYIGLYRGSLDASQLAQIWAWADLRFRVTDPF